MGSGSFPKAGAAGDGYQVGDIRFIASAIVPPGWLIMDGSDRSKTTYAALYKFLKENLGYCRYGEEFSPGTFKLPDARGRFLRFTSLGSGNDPDAASRVDYNLGGTPGLAGDNVGSKQADQYRAHIHNTLRGGASVAAGIRFLSTAGVANGSLPTDTNGGGNETRGINIYFTGIIKYK